MGGHVRYWVRKYHQLQDLGNYNSLYRLVENDEMINGLLLSDATITKGRTPYENSRLQMMQAEKNEQLCLKLQSHLQDLGFDTGTYKHNSKYKWKGETRFGWKTLVYSSQHPVFTWLRKKWYPQGKKIVPDDVVITPKTLAYWFMGDGSTTLKGKQKNVVHLVLCTEGFIDEDLQKLKIRIEFLGINGIKFSNQVSYGKRLAIYKSEEQVKFLNIIAPYVLPIFMYKMKYPSSSLQKQNDLQIKQGGGVIRWQP